MIMTPYKNFPFLDQIWAVTYSLNFNLQGGDYVPVRQNRGCYEAVIEVILKILNKSHNT